MKKLTRLNKNEIEDAVAIQKEIIESFAKTLHKYKYDKGFEVFAISISLVISNMLNSLIVSNVDLFMDDLKRTVMSIHNDVKKYSSYMEFKDGKKVGEGEFN